MLLDGMRIVSFCHFLQGPAATQYLADMGAEVIKIEPPQGAYERHWAGADGVKVGGLSALFLCANRGARSVAIDLKHPTAREVVLRLIARSHVVVENFRPGTLDRLGLGYEAVKARKPDIIYASASGFGSTGPYAGQPGQDLLIQAMSGLIAATARGGREPTAIGCAAVDQHGGALLALGILGAYVRWLRTGEGTRVESSLLGAGIDLQNESLVTYFASGLGREGFIRDEHLATWFHEAPYGVYAVADGHVVLSLNPLDKLAAALDSPRLRALVGRNAYRDRDLLAATLAEELAGWPFAELAAAFDRERIWYARVEDYDGLRRDPQVLHNEVVRDVVVNGTTVRLIAHPVRYDGRTPDPGGFALRPGADTRDVLAESGYGEDEIAALLRDRVVFAPAAAGQGERA